MQKTLVLSIIWSKCECKDNKVFKEEESIEILTVLGLINNNEEYQKYDWRKYKSKNYFIEEIKQNELIRKKHRKVCKILTCAEHLFFLASTVTGCVLISVFASLVAMHVLIVSSAVTIFP